MDNYFLKILYNIKAFVIPFFPFQIEIAPPVTITDGLYMAIIWKNGSVIPYAMIGIDKSTCVRQYQDEDEGDTFTCSQAQSIR